MNNSKLRNSLPLALVVLLFVFAQIAQAQSNVTYDAINDVAKGLFCPVCESEPLDTCATQACQDWRDEIGIQLSEGKTKAQIHENFRARYGDRVLAEPPVEGLNLILWFGIPVALLVGGFFFVRYLRQIRTPAPATPRAHNSANDDLDPDFARYLEQVEREVNKK